MKKSKKNKGVKELKTYREILCGCKYNYKKEGVKKNA